MSHDTDQLRSIIERVERLEEEIAGLNSDKKDVFAEARGNGYDVAALKAVLKVRRTDPAARSEHEAIVATYMAALGMIDAPLVHVHEAPARRAA